MNDAISSGKVELIRFPVEVGTAPSMEQVEKFASLVSDFELIRFPVEVGTAPSMEQVEKFASLVSDCNKRPIYLHSKEGVWGTSTVVSRWWQYMTCFAS
ncbi:hypothetical protein GOBAR_DD06503 [Gossypium barbadense]|nr:hypothetical protein GOBAR_DD06503 [Gossypium barbadense]